LNECLRRYNFVITYTPCLKKVFFGDCCQNQHDVNANSGMKWQGTCRGDWNFTGALFSNNRF